MGTSFGRTTKDFDLEVVVRGAAVDRATVDSLRRKVLSACRPSYARVRFARAKIDHLSDPSVSRPAIVAVTLDVDGVPVRAHAAAGTTREAIDVVEERLRRQLVDARRRLALLRGRREEATPGEWRHGEVPTGRPDYFPRAIEEREVVRRKTYSYESITAEDAVVEMELLDHDFHLFIDSGTGRDAVVQRKSDGAYELSLAPKDHDGAGDGSEIPVGPPPQTLTLRGAVERLNLTNDPFIFFVDVDTGRGAVLYRRYDGHYGLVMVETGDEHAKEDGHESEGGRHPDRVGTSRG
jgi:ribosome-associated translation inhibitor RaiA